MEPQKSVTVTITPGTIFTTIGIVLALWLIVFLKSLVLIILTAIVLASAIEPGVRFFVRRYRFSRALAVALIYVVVLGILFSIAYLFIPPLVQEARGFLTLIPQYVSAFNIQTYLPVSLEALAHQSAASTLSLTNSLFGLETLFTQTSSGAFHAISVIFGGVVSFVLIIVLSFYFAVAETGVDDFISVVVPVEHQEYAIGLWKRSHHKIGLWMQGQLMLSLIMGIFAFLWLTIVGVPYAFIIAVVAAFAELVPIFGPLISGVVAVIVAVTSGGLSMGLLAGGGFVILHQLESHLIYPLVVKKVVGVPPILVILALIVGGQIAGFLGIVLSVPIAAALQELVSDIQKAKKRKLIRLKAE